MHIQSETSNQLPESEELHCGYRRDCVIVTQYLSFITRKLMCLLQHFHYKHIAQSGPDLKIYQEHNLNHIVSCELSTSHLLPAAFFSGGYLNSNSANNPGHLSYLSSSVIANDRSLLASLFLFGSLLRAVTQCTVPDSEFYLPGDYLVGALFEIHDAAEVAKNKTPKAVDCSR